MGCAVVRPAEACRLVRKSKTQLYGDVADGLLAPQIKLGARASAFLVAELEAVVRARAGGLDENGIRELVSTLIATRGPDRDDADVRHIAASFHAARTPGAGRRQSKACVREPGKRSKAGGGA